MAKLNLQKREKIIVTVGVVVGLLLVFQFAAKKPLQDYRNARIAASAAQQRIEQARSVRDQILSERTAREALKKAVSSRGQGDLASFVNHQLSQAGLLKDRASWKNSTRFADANSFDQLDVTLTGVTLEEIVNFLHGIYSGGNVVVAHTMRIEPVTGGTGLTCHVVFLSPKV